MSRRVSRLVHVIGALEDGPASFKELRERIEEKYGRKIADPVLAYNLKKLMNEGLVTKILVTIDDGRSQVKYTFSPSYHQQKLQTEIINIIQDAKILHFGPEFPSLLFDDGKYREYNELRELDENVARLARRLAGMRLESIIWHHLDRGGMGELFARLLWVGFHLTHRSLERMIEEYPDAFRLPPDRPPNITCLGDLLELERHVRLGHPKEWKWERVVDDDWLFIYLNEALKEIGIEWDRRGLLSKRQFLLLCQWAVNEAYNDYRELSGDVEEHLTILKEKRDEIEAFLKKVGEVRFIVVIPVGYKEIEEAFELEVIDRFEKWRKALREGKRDHRLWIFKEGVETLRKVIKHLKREPKPDNLEELLEDLGKLDPVEQWTLLDLYTKHPQGQSVEFYESLMREIEERLDDMIRRGERLGWLLSSP